jgi:hypothetical protein
MMAGPAQAMSRHFMDTPERGFFGGWLCVSLHPEACLPVRGKPGVCAVTVGRIARVFAHAQPGFFGFFRPETYRGEIRAPMGSVTKGLML